MQWSLLIKMEIKQEIEEYRIRHGNFRTSTGDTHGMFHIPFESNTLRVISSGGIDKEWEHVSVSLKSRCPNWREMCFIKDLFWSEDDCVMQLHPPKSDYVNNHQFCLHMWKPLGAEIPRPPTLAVGIK